MHSDTPRQWMASTSWTTPAWPWEMFGTMPNCHLPWHMCVVLETFGSQVSNGEGFYPRSCRADFRGCLNP